MSEPIHEEAVWQTLGTWVLKPATLSLNLSTTLLSGAPRGKPGDLAKPQSPLPREGDSNSTTAFGWF